MIALEVFKSRNVTPRQAFDMAREFLERAEKERVKSPSYADMDIYFLELRKGLYLKLKKAGYSIILDLVQDSLMTVAKKAELLDCDIDAISNALSDMGLRLGMSEVELFEIGVDIKR